jgi:hypothetical protein
MMSGDLVSAPVVLVLRRRSDNTVRLQGGSEAEAAAVVLATVFGTEALVAAFRRGEGDAWSLLEPTWTVGADEPTRAPAVSDADRAESLRRVVTRVGEVFAAEWTGSVSVGGLVYDNISEWASPGALPPLVVVGWSAEDRAVMLDFLESRAALPHLASVSRWDNAVRFGLVDIDRDQDVEPGLAVTLA